jgi:hypothetical protein
MILEYETLTDTFPEEAIYALVRDCVLSIGDFSNASPSDLNLAIEQALQKIKSGKLLVEYGENSESFALVDKSKLGDVINK